MKELIMIPALLLGFIYEYFFTLIGIVTFVAGFFYFIN